MESASRNTGEGGEGRGGLQGPALVATVAPGSPAAKAGLEAGDLIWRVDGERMRDLIDLYVALADDVPHLCKVQRGESTLVLEIDPSGSEVGLEIAEPLFGEVITCDNSCMFCFVDQLPAGLRETLYVKDDDYRLSFLGGNFVTLTNVTVEDIDRIVDERLSPLYVSVQATEPEVRRRMFGNARADRGLENLRLLLEEPWMDVHVQVVLVKGVNDGMHLDATLEAIREIYPGVRSVGLVPVGITSGGLKPLDPAYGYDGESARAVLGQIEGWRPLLGPAGPFAADEFFFLAGLRPPAADYYADYPQLENGIGMARWFADQFARVLRRKRMPVRGREATTIVTTPMGDWALAPLGLEEMGVELLVCRNSLFGERVTVCGLLPGRDVISALLGAGAKGRVLVPGIALGEREEFVDGVDVSEVELATGVEVVVVADDPAALIRAIRS